MKKIFLTLGLAAACLTSNAFERVLYQQNFETVTTPEAAGWSFGGESMTIASDAFGKFLDLSLGQNNGRSGQVTWGDSIYMDKDGKLILEDNCYRMAFDFCIQAMPTNQFNSEITVFTNHAPIANNLYRLPWSDSGKPAHQRGVWENFIFDLSQCNTAAESDMLVAINAPLIVTEGDSTAYGINNYSLDTADAKTISTGTWVTVVCDVNVAERTVDYSVETITGETVASGTMTVPEEDVNGDPISMYAAGLYTLLARYQSTFLFDNILISCEVEKAFANAPTIALTRLGQNANDELDLNVRAYTITFVDGETLHVKGTDGKTVDVEWAECDGAYIYETTTSGVLEAWTTCEESTSDVVKENVDCSPCKLPSVTATISAVEEGYGKTYTLTISNADVPLRPTIFIDYEFTGVNGEKVSGTDAASGVKLAVTEEGTLKLTSKAFGYESTESSVDNNLEFKAKKVWDFARMTEAEYTAAGFTSFEVLNSANTSGFDNWTARKRLYYSDANSAHPAVDEEGNETGETAYDTVYPFGFISEDNTENVVEYSVITDNTDNTKYFEGLEIFPTDRHVGYLKHIGIYNDETANNYNPITIKDVAPSDFIVVNIINNYGGNSCHPIVASNEEYYKVLTGEDVVISPKTLPSEGNNKKGENTAAFNEETNLYDVNYCLYRIDTACTTITIFSQVGGDAVEGIAAEKVSDNWYYSIDGVRMAQPTRPGLYIHNGKKIIVK